MDLDRRQVTLACGCGAQGEAVFETPEVHGMIVELSGPFTRRDGGGARCLLCGSLEAVLSAKTEELQAAAL